MFKNTRSHNWTTSVVQVTSLQSLKPYVLSLFLALYKKPKHYSYRSDVKHDLSYVRHSSFSCVIPVSDVQSSLLLTVGP
jgi:hypothetical protein